MHRLRNLVSRNDTRDFSRLSPDAQKEIIDEYGSLLEAFNHGGLRIRGEKYTVEFRGYRQGSISPLPNFKYADNQIVSEESTSVSRELAVERYKKQSKGF